MNSTLCNTCNDSITTDSSIDLVLFTGHIVHRSVLLVYFILGLIGNICNIYLFTRPVLLQTSSSRYLLATAVANLLVTVFVLPFRFLADGFDLELTSYSLLACRLVSYIYYVCLALPPLFTVLACVDRWAASCIEVHRRRFANVHITNRLIPLIIIVAFLLYLHVPVTVTLDPTPPPPYCSFNGSYAIIGLTFQLIEYAVVPPLLMTTFSIFIIFNVIGKRNRIIPAMRVINTSANERVIRRDHRRLSQMQVMLVCQSIIECMFTLPFSIINLLACFVNNDDYFLTIFSYVRLFIFFNYVSSFYVYTLSSKLYRDEFKKLLKKLAHCS